jgi:heme exporter protein C
MQIYANPARFLKIVSAILPLCWIATGVLLAIGLYGALVTSPADYQQGEAFRIMYVHVPAAWLAMLVYGVMALASASAYIFRHPLADAAAKAAAPIGAVFCFLALATGSIWGKPMWGTWWEWQDPRLMSVFILFLLYLGYIGIWQAVDDPHQAAPLARIMALVGALLLPVIKFSVTWWNSLHQAASVLRMDGPQIAMPMLWPLLVMGLGYMSLFLALHLTATRSEIASRKLRSQRLSDIGRQ